MPTLIADRRPTNVRSRHRCLESGGGYSVTIGEIYPLPRQLQYNRRQLRQSAIIMRIAIFGAGSIGCTIGGKLAAGGLDVDFLGRAGLGGQVSRHGLMLSHHSRDTVRLEPGRVAWHTDPRCLGEAATVLVCAKSTDTGEAASQIARHAPDDTIVVSLQNGIGNVATLRDALDTDGAESRVLAGMVGFNVVAQGDGRFHCGTDGDIVVENHARARELVASLRRCGFSAHTSDRIEAVQWGKLLMNLNNAINVLAGMPLRQQLMDRHCRRALALSVEEGLTVLRAANIKPARVGRVRPALIPAILRLPDFAFRLVARSMLKIDAQARSSMWEDLERGRTPEIDFLNGAITFLGRRVGVETPINDTVIVEVRKAFEAGKSPRLAGEQILRTLCA